MDKLKVRQEVQKETIEKGIDYIKEAVNKSFPTVEDITLTNKGEVEWSQGSGVPTVEITKLISKL